MTSVKTEVRFLFRHTVENLFLNIVNEHHREMYNDTGNAVFDASNTDFRETIKESLFQKNYAANKSL